jgi:hypothetical protein
MAWETHTATTIESDPATVWDVLTDFSAYDEWNPTLVRARGTAEIGEYVWFTLSLPNGITVPFRPRVTVVEPNRELRWGFSVDDVLRTEHAVSIVPTDGTANGGRVRLLQRERVTGPFAVPVMGVLGATVRAGVETMSESLARRAEFRFGSGD